MVGKLHGAMALGRTIGRLLVDRFWSAIIGRMLGDLGPTWGQIGGHVGPRCGLGGDAEPLGAVLGCVGAWDLGVSGTWDFGWGRDLKKSHSCQWDLTRS